MVFRLCQVVARQGAVESAAAVDKSTSRGWLFRVRRRLTSARRLAHSRWENARERSLESEKLSRRVLPTHHSTGDDFCIFRNQKNKKSSSGLWVRWANANETLWS